MITKKFRRAVAAVLSVALLLGAPGTGAYQAAAQSMARVGSAAEAAPRLIAPSTTFGAPALSPLGAPSLGAAPSAASVAPAFAATPAAVLPAALAPASPSAVSAALPAAAAPSAVAPSVAPAVAAKTAAVEASSSLESFRGASAERSAAPSESSQISARVFDGAIKRAAASEDAVAPVSAPAARPRKNFLRRAFAAAAVVALSVGLSLPSFAQTATPAAPPAAQTVAAPANQTQAAAPADTQQVALPRPLTASISVDRNDATVGERLHLTVVLHNPSAKTVTVAALRDGLTDALPEDLEIQGKGAEAPLVLAPGETKTVVYEVIPFASGEIAIKDAVVSVTVAETAAYPDGIEIVVPDSKVTVKSVLTPDWKEKGLRDIVDVMRARSASWVWVAGGALGFLLLIGLERILAARRFYPKLDSRRLSLVADVEAEIARLERESDGLSGPEFHAAVQETVTRFMVDFAGLPHRERAATVLARDLKSSKAFRAEHVALAVQIAERAEAARFSGQDEDAAGRARELARLRALVEAVAGKTKEPAAGSRGGLNAFAAASGLQFGSPWALLLFIPFTVYLWKAWRARGSGERFAVSSAAHSSAHRSWREKLAAIPRAARLSAIALLILAVARPMIGVQRLESYTPSTDTMIVEDRSGSMDEKMGDGTKLQAAAAAIRAYVDEQRKGTQNRVGMETFDDVPYVDVRLTTDYDALISHLKEIKTGGSTAIGEGILTSIGHFAEVNMMDLDEAKDPRVGKMKTILRTQGLAPALEYAKGYPDLMDQVLRPDRAKVVVVFTDGESNSGIDPADAAKIAASLGVKIYTVGVGDSFDATTLQNVSAITKAQFFKAGDAERMTQVLLEISRLEKSPTKIISSVSIKDYTALLALIAFMLLGAEAALGNTRLRTLQGLILAVSLHGMPLVQTFTPANLAQVQTSAADKGKLSQIPPEMAEGNSLYAQGRYDEAVKKYAEAVAAHPDVPELYFNMADAYLRMGDADRAQQAYQKYLDLTPDPVKQSQALFNLGNSALAQKDAAKAVEFYKEALRRDPNNQDAKWNLEALKQQQKDQQQQQSQKQQKGKKGQKGQKGQKGDQKGDQKSDQKGDQKSDQPGQPGQGDPKDPSKDPKGDKKQGAEQLTSKLGDQQSKQDEAARKAITRKGTGVWGAVALPLAGLAGHGIAFTTPWILAAAAAGVPLVGLLIWYGLRANMKAARELSPGTAPKSPGAWWGLRRYLQKSALVLAALGLIGVAATDPRGGSTDERVNFGGKDMIVAVDGSHSFVYAEDGRMDQAKKDLTQFIERLQGTDRVGLVVFAGQARTASPISIDYGNFEFKVNRLEAEARGLKEGSDLGAAVTFAAESFDNAKKIGDRPRILIVVSDGEAFDSEIEAAIKAAKDHNVTIYTIGMGTAAGTKMKVPTEDGKGTEYIIDSQTGQPAVSHLVEAKLRKLAESTGGAYFHADKGATIDKVMGAVAAREKGRQGDTIKSPSPIGTYLLWPALALLLLDLLLPGRSLLRRDVPEKGAPKSNPKSKKKGAGLLGAALLPLAAWPQILPFALLGVVVTALLAYDVWNNGALTRSVRESWQRRTKFIAKGVRSDLGQLFDLREADAPRLDAFVARWQAADDKVRPALIAQASADDALWREMLTAAYLSGASATTHEAVLTALRRTSRDRLEPLTPVVGRIAARRGALAWLDHSDAEARLKDLEETASGQPFAVPVPAAPAPVRRTLRSRLSRAAVLLMLAASTAVSVLSVDGTIRFAHEQAAAEQTAFKIFYGADDLYIFSDRYIDERIPREVLPAFRAWHKPVKSAGPDFERAIQILRESPDPKADNLLIVAFRHAGLLPIDEAAQTTLLKALIERDSDALWASMDKAIAQSGDDPAQAALLVKLVVLGVESGNDNAFTNLFRVLKSPNEQVRGQAFKILYGAMASSDKTPFFPRLTAINQKFSADPDLQMWSEVFALRRLSSPDAASLKADDTKAFVDQLLKNAAAADAKRPLGFAQALAAAQKSGQDPELPPSMLAQELALMGQFEAQAQGQDGASPVPPVLAGVARYAVNQSVTVLIQEAEKNFPGLHERLIKDGVVLPDSQSSGGYYGGDDDERGYYGERFRGYSSTSQNYRELYKLAHLRALQADVAEFSAAAQKAAGDDAVKLIIAAELGNRVDAAMKASLETGASAGMLEGGTEPEKVADELQPLLKDGVKAFTGTDFLTLLRANNLAPSIGDPSSALAYPETLDAAQLSSLRGLLADMAKTGKLSGGSRELTWAEKLYVAKSLDAVDAAARAHFPASATAVAVGFDRPDQDGVAVARLSQAIDAAGSNADALIALENRLIARLAGPKGAAVSADDLKQVLPQLLKALDQTPRGGESLALLVKAVDAKSLPSAALEALRPQAFESLKALGEKFSSVFPDEADHRMIEADMKITDSEWRTAFKLRHYDALLKEAREAAAAAKASPAGLSADQKKFMENLEKNVASMRTFAAKLGVPAGDGPGELNMVNLNKALHMGWAKFPGTEFYDALADKGLANKGTTYNRETSWFASYNAAQVKQIRDFMAATLASGRWTGKAGTIDLTDEDKTVLRDGIKAADGLLGDLAKAPGASTSLHGLAPIGLLLAASSLGYWLFAGAVAAVATWLIWKYAFRAAPVLPPSLEARAASAEARRTRIAFAAQRMANSVVGGAFRSRFIGAGGSEFAEARPYQNEDYREIDWKTTAKKGETYAKKFELERDMPLILMVDISRSGRFGTRGADKRAVIEDVAATLALAASRTNVRVGAVLFSDHVEAVIPVRGGAKHTAALIDAMMNAEPTGRGTDLKPALEQILGLSKSRAMVAVVSDFLAPDFKDALAAVAARHDLRAIRVVDPAETRPLPDVALLPLVDAESGAQRTLDTGDKKVRSDAAVAIARHEAKLEDDLLSARARPIVLSTEGDPLETLAAHFDPKRRNAP